MGSVAVVTTATIGVGEALSGRAFDATDGGTGGSEDDEGGEDDEGDEVTARMSAPVHKNPGADAAMRSNQLELALEDAFSRVAGLQIERVRHCHCRRAGVVVLQGVHGGRCAWTCDLCTRLFRGQAPF